MSPNEPDQYITKTGRVLTDADFEALADEAERGYDIHKAEPASEFAEDATSICVHCHRDIRRVPGGHGPTWVHVDTGAVAGPGRGNTEKG